MLIKHAVKKVLLNKRENMKQKYPQNKDFCKQLIEE